MEEFLKPSHEWNESKNKKTSLNSKTVNALFCVLDKKEFHRVLGCFNAYEVRRKL